MNIQETPIEKVIPYARNPRRNEAAVAKVAASIKEFGFKQPIVVDKDMVVVVGHTRLLAAQNLEMKTVPVVIADDLSETQAKAYRLADNRVAEEALWNRELLGLELRDLEELDFDLDLTGFDEAEVMNIFNSESEFDPNKEWDSMPEFNQEDEMAYRTIKIHFRNETDVQEFSKIVSQNITEKTKYLWHPEADIIKVSDKSYSNES